jgi:hypothetical protein
MLTTVTAVTLSKLPNRSDPRLPPQAMDGYVKTP